MLQVHRGQPRGKLITITACRHRQRGHHTSVTAQPPAENLSWEQGKPPGAHHSQHGTLWWGSELAGDLWDSATSLLGSWWGQRSSQALQDPGPASSLGSCPFSLLATAKNTAQGKVIQNTKPAQLCLLGHLCLPHGSLGHGTASPCAPRGEGVHRAAPAQPQHTNCSLCRGNMAAAGAWTPLVASN